MANFKVNFYKLQKEESEKGKMEIVGSEYIGSVTVEDTALPDNVSVVGLAYRRAPSSMLVADKVVVEKLS